LEDKHVRRDRGTIAIGALAITAIFMIAVRCLATIIVEYNRYAYAVKMTSEKLPMRGKEKLSVEQISNKKIRVRNEGSTTSFIIGVFAIKLANNNVKYVKLAVPTGWKISVATTYGNDMALTIQPIIRGGKVEEASLHFNRPLSLSDFTKLLDKLSAELRVHQTEEPDRHHFVQFPAREC